MVVFVVVLNVLLPDHWTGPWKYARQFDVPVAMVHWKDKPKNCDYLRSPMGDKGCHYKISIAAVNSTGDLVGGDGAPLFRENADTKQTLVSYDRGNSWHPRGRDTSNAVSRVIINWVKIDD